MNFPGQNFAGPCMTAPRPARVLDQAMMTSDEITGRLAAASNRLQGLLERFNGAEVCHGEKASAEIEFGPGLVSEAMGRQHVQMRLLSDIEDKLDRLELI